MQSETKTQTPKWAQEFPGFPPEDMPPLSPEWKDMSWRNDAGPNFYNDRLNLWLFVMPRDRGVWPWDDEDCANQPRFAVYYNSHDGAPLVESDLAYCEGEEWADIEAAINDPDRERERRWLCDRWTACLGVGWHPDNRGASYTGLTEYEQREYDANMERLFEISPDPYADGLAALERAGLIKE